MQLVNRARRVLLFHSIARGRYFKLHFVVNRLTASLIDSNSPTTKEGTVGMERVPRASETIVPSVVFRCQNDFVLWITN